MLATIRSWWWEPFAFAAFFCLVGYQIFLPPVTGLANNSDFSKVLGKLSICSADRETQNNVYLVTDYLVSAECAQDMGLLSIEVPLVTAALRISARFTGPGTLDLRYLAALHFAILLLAFAVVLGVTRRAPTSVRYGIPVLFIVIFSDVAYTAYLNSVYMDAPAMVLLVAASAIAAGACMNHRPRFVALMFFLSAGALIFSKPQHALLGFAFAGVAAALALRPAERLVRIDWWVVTALLSGCAAFMLASTPQSYKSQALFDVVFSRLAPHNDLPWDVLREVGLGDEDLKHLGSHAFLPNSPINDPAYAASFTSRTSYGKVAMYYLRHPDVVLEELNRDLTHSAPILRPTDMPNFREKDGMPPRTMATRFAWWSGLRAAALRVFPYHVILIYLAPWIAIWFSRKRHGIRTFLPLALALSAAGVVEFAFSALTDALDNARHLFIFQVLTELLILLCAAALPGGWKRSRANL